MAKSTTQVWDKLVRRLKVMKNKPHVRVGIFGDATKAAAHEYGAPGAGIPERSFIRLTFIKQEQEQKRLTAKLLNQVVEKGMEVPKVLALLGTWGAAQVKATITKGPQSEWPELSEPYGTDKAERGKTKMLVDTGEMVNSITYQVKLIDDNAD